MKYKYLTGILFLLLALSLVGCTMLEAVTPQTSAEESLAVSEIIEERPVRADVLPEGTTAYGVDLSLKSEEDALASLKEAFEKTLSQELKVTDQDKSWSFTLEQLGVSFDYDAAWTAVKEENQDIKKEGAIMPIQINASKLNKEISSLSKDIDEEPVDAYQEFWEGEFTLTEDVPGRKLNVDKSVEAIQNYLKSGAFIQKAPEAIELVVEPVKAKMTADLLKEATTVIGSYATYYNVYEEARSRNLVVASSKINGSVIQPGEMFSFNNTIAPITEEEGYDYANIISGGEYVPGIGGGVCQVATTLYNAVLLAELEVNERYCHAFPASYVPLGMDCTVFDGSLDFCFTNNTEAPIYVQSWCGDGEIGVVLYGKEIHDPSREVSYYYEIIETYDKPEPKRVEDPEMTVGEEEIVEYGHIGYLVETYKTITENGNSVTEWYSESIYDTSPDKIRVGTKPAEETPEEPSEETPEETPPETPAETPEEVPQEGDGGEAQETPVETTPEEGQTEENTETPEETPVEETTETPQEENTENPENTGE